MFFYVFVHIVAPHPVKLVGKGKAVCVRLSQPIRWDKKDKGGGQQEAVVCRPA